MLSSEARLKKGKLAGCRPNKGGKRGGRKKKKERASPSVYCSADDRKRERKKKRIGKAKKKTREGGSKTRSLIFARTRKGGGGGNRLWGSREEESSYIFPSAKGKGWREGGRGGSAGGPRKRDGKGPLKKKRRGKRGKKFLHPEKWERGKKKKKKKSGDRAISLWEDGKKEKEKKKRGGLAAFLLTRRGKGTWGGQCSFVEKREKKGGKGERVLLPFSHRKKKKG